MTPRVEVQRALRFVAENLERPITAAEIARAAGLSEFHFHREFHAAVGESIGRFITRRRLETAALRLAYEPDVPVTQIALSSGYSSNSNFSKAFSAYFGCSPSRVRSPTEDLPRALGRLTRQYGQHFDPRELYALPPEPDATEVEREAARWNAGVRFEESPGCHFVCLASSGGYDYETIARTWADLIPRVRQLGIAEQAIDAWGFAHDSPVLTAPERCRYHACVPAPRETNVAPPLFTGEMLAGRYAVFRYAGPVAGVGDAYRSIYSCWFRHSSVAPEDFSPLDHYVSDEPRDGHVEMEMWFRIRPR